MTSTPRKRTTRLFRPFRGVACLCLLFAFTLTGCANTFATNAAANSALTVSINPIAGEDLTGPCVFDLLLQQPGVAQAGTLVIYERGDSSTLFNDATLRATALTMHFSMVFAHECDAASTGVFQADAAQGPARILFAALDQFASGNHHPELATNGVVLYGFSAAAVLTATMANLHPDRLLGAVEYAPADAHVALETVPVTAAAAKIPTLLLANALDTGAGTYRALDFFTRGRAQGARWALGVQNATGHCCTLSTRNLLVPFLQAVGSGASGSFPASATASFQCAADGYTDAQGYPVCAFTQAALPATAPSASDGWLPDRTTANAWLTWVQNPATN